MERCINNEDPKSQKFLKWGEIRKSQILIESHITLGKGSYALYGMPWILINMRLFLTRLCVTLGSTKLCCLCSQSRQYLASWELGHDRMVLEQTLLHAIGWWVGSTWGCVALKEGGGGGNCKDLKAKNPLKWGKAREN